MMKKTKFMGIYRRRRMDGVEIYYVRCCHKGKWTWRAAGPSLDDARALHARLKYNLAPSGAAPAGRTRSESWGGGRSSAVARVLSREELDHVLENVSPDHRDAIVIAMHTGCRLAEIATLRRENVQEGIIRLEHTKNGRPREIPIASDELAAILERRFNENGGRLFKQSPATLSQRFHRERVKLGGKAWRFHDLRHGFASALVAARVDLETTRELLGHSSLAMTSRYVHGLAAMDRKREAVSRISLTKSRIQGEPGIGALAV